MRKSYYIFFTIFLFCIDKISAQKQPDSTILQGVRSFIKLNFSSDLGVEWEKRIGLKSSLTLFAGYSYGIQSDEYGARNVNSIWSPDVYVEYRNYYNLLKRIEKAKVNGKGIRFNSSEFLFGRFENVFGVQHQNSYNNLLIEGLGTQRHLFGRFMASAQFGVAQHFYFDKAITGGFNKIKIEPMANISVLYFF
jgi:hypothetical protein